MAKKKATEADELKERLKSWQGDKPDLFKPPDFDADYQHWVQMRYWTAHEAVTLSLGKDPNKIPRDRITSLRPDSYAEDSFPVRYTKRFQVLDSYLPELAVERINLYRSLAKLQPGAFVQWATVKGWDLPEEIASIPEVEVKGPLQGRGNGKGREETLLSVIAALLERVTAKQGDGVQPKSPPRTQEELIDQLQQNHGLSLSKSSMQKIFSESKKLQK